MRKFAIVAVVGLASGGLASVAAPAATPIHTRRVGCRSIPSGYCPSYFYDWEGLPQADVMRGGPGPDHFRGGLRNDLLIGREGDDYLDGEAGNDEARGGQGRDVCLAETTIWC